MTQSTLVNGNYPDIKLGNKVTEVVKECHSGAHCQWKDIRAVAPGIMNGTRVPIFPENAGPAVIRLTHDTSVKTSYSSCQAATKYENLSNQVRRVSHSTTHVYEGNQSPSLGNTVESTCSNIGANSFTSHNDSHKDTNEADKMWSQTNSIFPSIHDNQYNANAHLLLLQSQDNCRPSSKNSHHTADSQHSTPHSLEQIKSLVPNDEESLASEGNKRPKSRCASHKKKKGKKKKSKAKQQEAVNRLFNSNNKPKPLITDTMTKQKTEPAIRRRGSETTLRFTNLSDVLQAHTKPLTVAKVETKDRIEQRYTTSAPGVSNKTLSTTTKHPALLEISATPVHTSAKVPVIKSTPTFIAKKLEGSPYLQTGTHSHHITKSETNRITKIYLSEKHSGTLKDDGNEFPCAPPATPMPEQMSKVEYIPCMNDIRSQQAVRKKLQVMEREANKRKEIEKEKKLKEEKQEMKNREKDLKIRQRNEIYALNKIMTDLEFKNFKDFCNKKGIPI